MTLLLLLLGCDTAVTVHCESTDRTVPDEWRLDFGASVSDVLAEIGPATVEATDLAGAAVLIHVSMARGEGAVQLADGEIVEEVTRRAGRDRQITWEGDTARCADAVAVPVEITVVSDDGAVSVVGPATLTNHGQRGEIPSFEADYTLSPTDRLPAGLHGAPAGERLRITWREGAIVQVRGEAEAADGTSELVLWYGGP